MTDGNRGPSWTAGLVSETIAETAQLIEAWFDDVDYQNYAAGYRKLALSGTTGGLEALAKQQVGGTTRSGDPVDVASFLADAWLSSAANAWAATRDINEQFLNDLSRFYGFDAGSPPKRASTKKATKKTTKKTSKKRATTGVPKATKK